MAVTATADAPTPHSPSAAEPVDHEDSNISSPLSDVDDKATNEEDVEQMHLDPDEGDNSEADDPHPDREGSDSDSALSDANSDVNSDMNDTEAETERLYDTPHSQRRRDVYNDGQVFEQTPSGLRTVNVLDQGNPVDDESVFADDASVASSHIDGTKLPTTHAVAEIAPEHDDVNRGSHERKRKRPPVASQSDSEEPLRKRKGSVGALEHVSNDDTDHYDAVHHGLPQDHPSAGEGGERSHHKQSAEEGEEGEEEEEDEVDEDEVPIRETRMSRKTTRSESRREGADMDEAHLEADHEEPLVPHDSGAEELVHQNEEADADAEDEAEAAAKNLEEMERKQAAYKDWTCIEEMFGVFRDRLYKDRLERLEDEERSLLADVPTHSEYLNMKQCIDDQMNRKIEEINKELEYRIKVQEKRAVAARAQIWSQYFQSVREKREKALEALNKSWYEVQTARRNAHSLPEYGLLFPRQQTARLRNAIAYNSEVSTLAGIAKYEGFPAAPDMNGASQAEAQEDLQAIEQFRRDREKELRIQAREEYQTTFSHLGPAGEQFIKDTPWANPNHLAHRMHHAPASSSEAPSKRQGTVSRIPESKSAHQKSLDTQGLPGPSNTPAEPPELSRSSLHPGPHQIKRVNNLPSIARESKTAVA